ncbi:MAG: hypothetical protein EOO43_06275 [Flavobacterium sp.]|nr:MAG: hypothetical protein EOO43_06275 [Flavobacterium sp.]
MMTRSCPKSGNDTERICEELEDYIHKLVTPDVHTNEIYRAIVAETTLNLSMLHHITDQDIEQAKQQAKYMKEQEKLRKKTAKTTKISKKVSKKPVSLY